MIKWNELGILDQWETGEIQKGSVRVVFHLATEIDPSVSYSMGGGEERYGRWISAPVEGCLWNSEGQFFLPAKTAEQLYRETWADYKDLATARKECSAQAVNAFIKAVDFHQFWGYSRYFVEIYYGQIRVLHTNTSKNFNVLETSRADSINDLLRHLNDYIPLANEIAKNHGLPPLVDLMQIAEQLDIFSPVDRPLPPEPDEPYLPYNFEEWIQQGEGLAEEVNGKVYWVDYKYLSDLPHWIGTIEGEDQTCVVLAGTFEEAMAQLRVVAAQL